jgi:hypothetical protein
MVTTEKRKDAISRAKMRILDRDGWRCQYTNCCESATELAHCISQGEGNVESVKMLWNELFDERRSSPWIRANVIHHDLNLKGSCRSHNDSFNIGNNPAAVKDMLYEIYIALRTEGGCHETA